MRPNRPYVELMNFLLKCGDEVRLWVGRRLRGQCEQHWGALCGGLGGTCSLGQSDAPQHTTSPSPTAEGSLEEPTTADEPDSGIVLSKIDNATESGPHVSERTNVTAS